MEHRIGISGRIDRLLKRYPRWKTWRLENCAKKVNLDIFSAKITKYYKSISYSSDGEYIIAGGNSKFVNLYDIKTRLLVKKF